MLILVALLVTVSAVKPLSLGEHLAESIPEYARKLTGEALVNYVNARQSLFKTKYSPRAEELLRSHIMDKEFFTPHRKEVKVLKADMHANDDIPDRFDARERWPQCRSIGTIRDQSRCGSCWAVSSAGVMSDRACIQTNGSLQVHISDTDILTCCGSDCGRGCRGGWPHLAFEYVERNGVCTGGHYRAKNACKPYSFPPCHYEKSQAYDGICSIDLLSTPKCRKICNFGYEIPYEQDKIYVKKTFAIQLDQNRIKREIMTNGPLVSVFKVYEDFAYYDTGIYKTSGGMQKGTHAVRIIGWGSENGTDYWLIANSWNTDWGEDGFFRMIRGVNHCSIESNVVGGILNV